MVHRSHGRALTAEESGGGVMAMQINLDAPVETSGGESVGRLNEIVFALDSRRVAGFLVVVDGPTPREVLVMVGQVAEVSVDRITLSLSDAEVADLPDAHQHLYVAPGQDVEDEIAAAEGPEGEQTIPDPD